ncbi:hypothetical protein CIPAW_04G112700 [Carya illinoinensis]|uniref:Uncharacterized protein n=1 Tax=Carya illinoinensis TaxID=32201 RepID=A0A8T1QU21_CARIL|nr:hypothetical protein CIPAW_04G112700 [Carya illinoinensis]
MVSEEVNWEEPTPLISQLQSSNSQVSNWVLDKAKEIQHGVVILCNGFEDQSIALLAALEAGQTHSSSPGEINSAKKRARGLKGLNRTVNDGIGERSSNHGRSKGGAMDVVL